ncbi:MAG: NAD(P)-binding domain-containing protein [Myxococcales bacterium]|nr:NAD(P)-binding domain-containing protein [Myxococcales bacterium]
MLEVRRYVARVARPDDCCGLTLCEQRCPNGSLVVLETEPDTELPGLDDDLQSRDRPGIYLAGDLTGLPLIRNAINQGAHAVARIAESLSEIRPEKTSKTAAGEEAPLDLVIVGAGPAGISACLAAKAAGLRYVAVDQDTVAASIRSFPRGKLVFDQPLGMPHIGDLWLRESTKEELLGKWLQIIHREQLVIRERQRVTAIEDVRGGPPLGRFRVRLEEPGGGARSELEARRVLLAFGRRGTPRKLAALARPIPPGMESHVHYSLADARSFAGQRVLVVGLGDVAMETAIALARQPGTRVTVSYRGRGFKRGKRRNADELRRLQEAGRVELVFASELVELRDQLAILECAPDDDHDNDDRGGDEPRARRELACDAVFVMIGNLPPWPFLEQLGVRRARPTGA